MKEMTSGNPLKLILAFAFPMLLGNLLQQLYNMADAAIVGRFLGPSALAAVGATTSVQFLILGFCIGTTSGFCIPIAQCFGARNYKRMRSLLFNCILLTGLLALITTLLCTVFCGWILRILSTPQDIWADTRIYITIIFLGIPFSLLYNLAAGILRSVGDSKTPFLVLAVSTVSNIVLDLFFITILRWGCAGAALATILSQCFSGLLCAWFIIRKYEVLHIGTSERRINRHALHELLWIGVPMGLQYSITAIGSMVMQSANNSLGSLYASAFTAASRVKMFAMCPYDAIASATATFCSQNYGAGDYGRIRSGSKIGVLLAFGYGIFIGLCMILFGRTACLLFLSADEVRILDAARLYLTLNGLFFWAVGLINVTRITVQGLGFSGRAIFSGVMEMIARSFTGMLLVPAIGFTAICLADPLAWIAADLYIIPTFFYVLQKVKNELGHQDERVN